VPRTKSLFPSQFVKRLKDETWERTEKPTVNESEVGNKEERGKEMPYGRCNEMKMILKSFKTNVL
jgi:hypothetical protein